MSTIFKIEPGARYVIFTKRSDNILETEIAEAFKTAHYTIVRTNDDTRIEKTK